MATVRQSTISGNSAAEWGGGIFTNGGTLSVLDSTISGNTADDSGGGAMVFGTTVSVSNSTISRNNAAFGGGTWVGFRAEITLIQSTLSGNTAGEGGGIHNLQGAVNVSNTIIANSTGADCWNAETIIATGVNLIADGSCELGVLTGDPLLGPLADNGGPTFTHALLPGSPALDAGDDAVCGEAPVESRDQRGARRPQGAHCDLGAVERSVSDAWSGVLQPLNADGTSVFRAGATVPVRFQLTDDFADVADLVARFSYAKISNGVAGPVNEATSTSAATSGNAFRYDWNDGVYIFNWSTRGLGTGSYQVQIDLGDGLIHRVLVGLR